jgi:hypothetical protein
MDENCFCRVRSSLATAAAGPTGADPRVRHRHPARADRALDRPTLASGRRRRGTRANVVPCALRARPAVLTSAALAPSRPRRRGVRVAGADVNRANMCFRPPLPLGHGLKCCFFRPRPRASAPLAAWTSSRRRSRRRRRRPHARRGTSPVPPTRRSLLRGVSFAAREASGDVTQRCQVTSTLSVHQSLERLGRRGELTVHGAPRATQKAVRPSPSRFAAPSRRMARLLHDVRDETYDEGRHLA